VKNIIGTAMVATLALAGFSAHASCADPRTAGPSHSMVLEPGTFESHFGHNAADNIVGTWHVVYTTDGAPVNPTGEAFIQWHSDGTEWENINYAVLGGNICLGSWKTIDESHVSRNHYGWLYNPTNGLLAGWFNETETDQVAWDGNSYSGTNVTTLHFYPVAPATEGMTQVLKGTSTAKRIAP
jgi:hypothetical protein